MTKAARIRPFVTASNTTPFCEMDVDNVNQQDWRLERRRELNRRAGRRDDQCSNRSSYQINGVHMCHSHAGREALRLLMAQSPAAAPRLPGQTSGGRP